MGFMTDEVVGQPQVQQPKPQGGFMSEPEYTSADDFVDRVWASLENQESGGKQSAVSPKGAVGVAQVMPGTAPEAAALAGLPFDEKLYRTDADYNRKLGKAYLRKQYETFGGDESKALAAYNAGPGRVSKLEGSFDQIRGQLPQETQDYVRKISRNAGLKEVGRVLDTGVKGGLGAFPSMVVKGSKQISDYGTRLAEEIGIPSIPGLRDIPAPSDIANQAVDYLFAPIEKPQTEVGKAAANVLSSTIGAVTGPGGMAAPLKSAAAGLGAGLGAEGGQQVAGTPGAVIGGLLGGFAPAALGNFRNVKERLAGQALENVDDYQLAAAKDRMQTGQQQGVDLTLPQAVGAETNLDRLQDTLMRTKAGEPLAAQLRAQPSQIETSSGQLVKGLPGAVKGQQEVSNQAQQAASNAVGGIKAQRTEAVKPLYAQMGSIDSSDAQSISKELLTAVRGKEPLNRSKTMLRLYDKLNPKKKVLQDDGSVKIVRKPITNVQVLDDTLREFENKLSRKPKDPRAQALIQEQIDGIRDRLDELVPAYKQARQTYSDISKQVVNPAEQGPLGMVAGKTGYDPSVPASRSNLYGVFDRGTAEGGKSEILTLQKDMTRAKDGNKAFADAGTSWLADKLNASMKLEGGKLQPQTAANIEANLFGTPNQVRGTRDVVAGIARASGLDEADMVRGMENWAQTIKLAAKRPSSTQALSGREMHETTQTVAGKVAKSGLIQKLVNPLQRPLNALDNYLNQDAYSYMAKLMQSPEGIETLKKLARSKPGSPASLRTLATFNALNAQQQTEGE
jgi:hypothetical protein